MASTQVEELIARAESSFADGRTRRYVWRLMQLRSLHELLIQNNEILLNAVCVDTGFAREAAQESIVAIANLIVQVSQDLLKQVRHRSELRESVVSQTSALIIGNDLDPIGSLLVPLAYAVAAGSCAVLNPSEKHNTVALQISHLVPKCLDREAYCVYIGGIEAAFNAQASVIIITGPRTTAVPQSLDGRVLTSDTGLNVVAYMDTTTTTSADLVNAIVQSRKRSIAITAINVVLILQEHLAHVQTSLTKQIGTEIPVKPTSYITKASKTSSLVLIGVTSTEEALLYLTKANISRFTYFGDAAYGSYLLKFLPKVGFGSINHYDPAQLYPDLSQDSFQTRRLIVSKKSPAVQEPLEEFPPLPVKYGQNMNFFMQGYHLAWYSSRMAGFVTFAAAAAVLWRRLRI